MEWLSCVVTLVFSSLLFYKLLKNEWASVAGAIGSYALLPLFLNGGNLTEEYSLPFATIALYIFCCYFLEGTTSRAKVAVVGACLGCVLLCGRYGGCDVSGDCSGICQNTF